MTRFAASILLLALTCLLPRHAIAQASSPLPFRVVQLVPGDVVGERLVAMDSATYAAARAAVALVPAADRERVDRQQVQHLTDSLNTVLSTELRRCRQQSAQAEADFQQLASQARKAVALPARPLLLDGNFYKGCGVGAVALLVLRVLVLR